jgi:ADP-ribose pyrophosphatase YjhB (NUDIX family)
MLRWRDRILLCRHEKPGKEYWLLPGGGVKTGESLLEALERELAEEIGLGYEIPVEGPIALADSISPGSSPVSKHVVQIIFAGDLSEHSLEEVASIDDAVRGHRLFAPIQHFLRTWEPGDPTVYLGSLWIP